jgi:hypothetical protein
MAGGSPPANNHNFQKDYILSRMKLAKLLASGRKPFLAAFVAISFYPLAVHPPLASAQSATDSDDPATYNVNNSKTVLPLHICYYNGGRSFYLAIDASDQAVAKSFGANYVPQLANVLKDTQNKAFDNIYVVTNFKQFNVLPSSPNPVGPNNADQSYTPLWQLTEVTWTTTPRVLRSEAEILAAQSSGQLTVTPTNIVINCPVVYTTFGGRLPQAKVILGAGNDNDDK